MKLISALAVALSLSGCATCQQHKVACGVLAGVIVTSIAISVSHKDKGDPQPMHVPTPAGPDCAANPASCQ